MKTSNWFLAVMAAAITACGMVLPKTQAAEPASVQHPLRGHWLEWAKEKLQLTDAQIEKIKTELAQEKDPLKHLISNLHSARVDLRQAIQASGATETSVRAASASISSIEADLAVERLKLYGKISPILTAEQLEQLKEFRAQMDEFVEQAIDRIGDRLHSK
jgi:Spy/CpxP family protein refolding chaperone